MKKFLSVILVLVLAMTSLSAGAVGAVEIVSSVSDSPSSASSGRPEAHDYYSSVNEIRKAKKNDGVSLSDSKRVLLIQDRSPWDSDANYTVLNSLNANYSSITTYDFTADLLNEYGVVVLSNDQTTSTYNAYSSFTNELEKFIKAGGTVVYGACDQGWGSGDLSSSLPGGVKKGNAYHYNNYVVDATHPIVTGVLTDNNVLRDSDLYSNYCSHVYFIESTLPVGSNIILRSSENNAPTLIEYPLGEGMVIASGLTWEHNYVYHTGNDSYGTFAQKSMDDYFAYAIQYYNSTVSFEVDTVLNNSRIKLENLKYNDTYFNNSAYIYNHEMAKASMGLTISAMISDNTYKNSEAAEKLFSDLDFDNYTPFNYTKVPTTNSIACIIADKNIDKTKTSVIAIGIRGGGYEAEWGGNFNVGTAKTHAGFESAKQQVLQYLDSFLALYGNTIKYKDHLKFWISGYSRAAATSNLVAASLDDGTYTLDAPNLSGYSFSSKDIFAYTFETPRNTKNNKAKDSLYNNIYNIINRDDPVPRVAPAAWGYIRYGKDCYLPSPETSKSNYDRLLPKMKEYYKKVSGTKYSDFEQKAFEFKEIKVNYDINDVNIPLAILYPGLGLAQGFSVEIQTNKTMSKGLYLDGLLNIVAKALKSPDNYSQKYQKSLVKLASLTKGNTKVIAQKFSQAWERVCSKYQDVWQIAGLLVSASINGVNNTLIDTIKTELTNMFYDVVEGQVSKSEVRKMIDAVFSDVLLALASHPNYCLTTFENGGDLMDAHYSQVTTAWLYAIDGDFKNEGDALSKILSGGDSYRVATINCPVNVYVYDDEGILRGEIVDYKVKDIAENPLSVYVDDNGQMCFCLPNDGEYSFVIEGTDNGTMSCSFSDYDFEKGEKTTSKNYYDIPITKNSRFSVTLSEKSNDGISEDISIIDDDSNTVIEPTEVLDNSDEYVYTVTASSNCLGCGVIGGGEFYRGEYSQVTAIPGDEYFFLGWYDNNSLLTSDIQYRFRVKSDENLTAKFKKCEHNNVETVAVKPTCDEEGETIQTCLNCGYTKTIRIDPLGHQDQNNDGKCDICGELMTGDKRCPLCGKTHNGLIDKVVGLFHKMIYRIKSFLKQRTKIKTQKVLN